MFSKIIDKMNSVETPVLKRCGYSVPLLYMLGWLLVPALISLLLFVIGSLVSGCGGRSYHYVPWERGQSVADRNAQMWATDVCFNEEIVDDRCPARTEPVATIPLD